MPTPTAVVERHLAGEDVIAEACLAKQTAVECAAYVCDPPSSCTAGPATCTGTEVERHYRDARILPIGGGCDRGADRSGRPAAGYAS